MVSPNDPNDKPVGDRTVYETADGGAYIESAPGSGPRHHDDVPLTPAAVERKAHGDDPSMAELEQPRVGFLVVGAAGLLGAFAPDEADRAHDRARNAHGCVFALPMLADYRDGTPI